MARQHLRIIQLIALIALVLSSGAALAREWNPEYERRIGQQALEQVKREFKLWEDPEAQAQVLEIINDLKPHTQRPDVTYEVYLLDTAEVNAFSLPGSIICVTRGLMESVHSVHELAGVLAHEMAHNCTFDALNEASRAQQLSLPVFAAVVAAMITGRSGDDIQKVYLAGMYVAYGVLSTYSIDVETKADRNAFSYLLASGEYNPVGLLTFMERLAADERSRPRFTLGIFQTHPWSTDRVIWLADMIRSHGLELNRRAVTRWDPPTLVTEERGDEEVQVLKLWGQELFAFDWAPEDTGLAPRGEAMVSTLNDLLAAGVSDWEFYAGNSEEAHAVKARGRTVLKVYPEDGALAGTDPAALASKIIVQLHRALFAERLARLY